MKSVVLTILLVIPFSAFADFTEQAQFGAGATYSIGWGDYDNDGDPDLAVGNAMVQNYLYINNGDGTFTEQAQFGTGYYFSSLAWGDYDNDGDLDLAVGNTYYGNHLYINNGDGTFTEESQFGTGNNTYSTAWGDYDNDGDIDMAQGRWGQNYLYVNNGDGTFIESDQFGTGYAYSVAWGDYDNDADRDLAVANAGQNYLYINNGDGTFTEEIQFGAGETFSLAWGDCNNDGDLDMAVANIGQNYLYVNDGDSTFTEQVQFGTGNTCSMAWGDYDNDGDLDVAVGNGAGIVNQNYLYVNNGDGTFTEQAQFGEGATYPIAWGDYDNDGDLDLAVGNVPYNYLYINNEDSSDYLSLYLVGHYHDQGSGYSGRDGIGAKVLVYEEDYLGDDDHLLGFREVEANGGRCGQDSVYAEFGLPNDDTVEVRIVWPGSGDTNITQDIIADKTQFITVHEADDFHLLSPADGEDVGGFPLTLDWENAFATDLAGYTVEIATDADFADVVYTADVTDSEVTLDEGSGLTNDTYYWRVIANYEDTPGDYGRSSAESWSFTLTELDIALLYFEAVSEGGGISLSWDVNAIEDTEITGFNLYRSTDAAEAKAITSRDKLNAELITGESPYSYLDVAVEEGVTYGYWLEVIDVSGTSETFGPVECTWSGALPTTYALYQSRPNPATGTATIAFDLPEDTEVTLTVYDISGRKVATVVDEKLTVGTHERTVAGLAPGVYVYKLDTESFNAAKKMVVQ